MTLQQTETADPFFRSQPRWKWSLRRVRSQPLVVILIEDDHTPPLIAALNRRLEPIDARYQQFFRQYIDPILSPKRYQHAKALDLDPSATIPSSDEQLANRHIGISLSLLVGTALAQTVNPLFYGVSIAGSIYIIAYWLRTASNQWQEQRRIGFAFALGLDKALSLFLGDFLVIGISSLAIFSVLKIATQSRDNTTDRLIATFNQLPQEVWVIRDETEQRIELSALQPTDFMVVRAGDVISADGVIARGAATIDQQIVTGESQPVEKTVGDTVIAGTILMSGTLYIEVTETGQATITAQIVDLLNQNEAFHTQLEERGRKLADETTPPLLTAAGLGFVLLGPELTTAILWAPVGWPAFYGVPVSAANFLNVAADRQILVKDGRSLEVLSQVDTVIFDKTGTLTLEQPQLGDIHAVTGFSQTEVLTFAACAEYHQSHPIARAILEAAETHGIEVPVPDHIDYTSGMGLYVEQGGNQIRIGSERFMQANNLYGLDDDVLQSVTPSLGVSLIYVALNDTVIGVLELLPSYRPEAPMVIHALREQGIEVIVISGDHEIPTRQLAEHFGIDRYYAQTLPEDKAAIVQDLQAQGRTVCFVGDGINDGIALQTAQVGISIQGSTYVALDTAQIVLMDGTLAQLPYLMDLSNRFTRNLTTLVALATVPGWFIIGGIFAFRWSLYSVLSTLGVIGAIMGGIALAPAVREKYLDAPANDDNPSA